MEKFIELMIECKDGKFRPECIAVSDIIRIDANTFYDECPRVVVRRGKKIFCWGVAESYASLKARLGVLEIQQ